VTDSHCVQTTDGSFCTVTHQGNLATSQLTVLGVSLVNLCQLISGLKLFPLMYI
jgi:hypothetical protein